MYAPRELGMVQLRGEKLQVDLGVYEFGIMPAASDVHAKNVVWNTIRHVGPALLDANGKIKLKRKITMADLVVVECEKPDCAPSIREPDPQP